VVCCGVDEVYHNRRSLSVNRGVKTHRVHYRQNKLNCAVYSLFETLHTIVRRMKSQNNVLLLGMVFSCEDIPKRGQEYRDRVRCEALERCGYMVKTLDNKHDDAALPKHCNANFADTGRMMRSIVKKWDGEAYDHVILDYFMSPVRAHTRTQSLQTFPATINRCTQHPNEADNIIIYF